MIFIKKLLMVGHVTMSQNESGLSKYLMVH
jgi:hypothetical protein